MTSEDERAREIVKVDPETVELVCRLIEFRAMGLSPSSSSPVVKALQDTATALRKFLLEQRNED